MQKISIVEDDIDIQDILKNHLMDAGYEVAIASDGVAGIAMFDDTIDLVLLDIISLKSTAMVYVRSFAKGHKSLSLCLLHFRMKKTSYGGLNSRLMTIFQSPFRQKSCYARLQRFFAAGLRKITINLCLLIKSCVWILTDSMYIKAESMMGKAYSVNLRRKA